jgi:hypothetical protein
MKRIQIYFLCLIFVFPGVTGQTSGKKQYRAERLTSIPVIDGILDDEAWKNTGTWVDDFTSMNPTMGARHRKGLSLKYFMMTTTFMLRLKLLIQVPTASSAV